MARLKYLTHVKIAKRHNAAATLMGIFCLFSILIPGLLWLLPMFPWAKFYIESVPADTQFVAGSAAINILDLIKHLFNMPAASLNLINQNAYASSAVSNNILYYYIVKENVYAVAVWYFLSALLALILFIQGLTLLIRGKMTRKGAPVVTAFWAMVANGMLLLDAWRLGWYLNRVMNLSATYAGLEGMGKVVYTWLVPSLYIASAAGGVFIILFFIWLFGLAGRYYREDIEFIEVDPEKKPFERNNGVYRNDLPPAITNVGGHAFAKNTALEIAPIADGVTELGVGAFSNCLRLKVVSIPVSVKNIGANCFFNCGKLKRINYAGTKEDWRKITRGSNWLSKAGTTTVVCKDGAVSVDPYK